MPAPRQALRGPCSLLVICAHANLHSMFRTSCAPSAHAHRCGVLLYVHAYVNCAYPVPDPGHRSPCFTIVRSGPLTPCHRPVQFLWLGTSLY